MEFYRNGNRMRYEIVSFGRRMQLQALVLGECAENQGRFVDDIVNGIWAICEESFWDVAAHNHRTGGPLPLPDPYEPVVALFSAETGSTLAWTAHLVRTPLDAIDPILTRRVHQEIRDRLLDPFMARDNWRWLGFEQGDRPGPPNNWNPWIISNLLTMTMLIETDPERRLAIVDKCLRGLDKFLAGIPPGRRLRRRDFVLGTCRRQPLRMPRRARSGVRTAPSRCGITRWSPKWRDMCRGHISAVSGM